MTQTRPISLAEVARRVSSGERFMMQLADFLDEFRESPNDEAFAEEPALFGENMANGKWRDAFLAAAADHLTSLHRLKKRSWFYQHERYLVDPAFAMKSREGRIFLLKDSPAAFKSRNLFVSSNALERV